VGSSRARRLRALVALGAGSALALSACGSSLEVSAGIASPASAATISITPAPTGKPVAPADPLVVTAQAGRLTGVTVLGPDGPIPGVLSVDGRSFTVPAGELDYASTYVVEAAAVDRLGVPTSARTTVVTVKPSKFVTYSVSPRDGATVGVGMPVTLFLDRKVGSDAAKKRFEQTLSVAVDGAPAVGSWRWTSDTVVQYRPAEFWPGNATVEVTAALKGKRITTKAWGQADRTTSFTTGPAMVSYVDMKTLTMKVTRDGEVIRRIPVTTGKEGFVTRSGIKVISNKERTRLMDAATGGTDPDDPEYYRLEVEYAMRLTNSGEFIHAAPWSLDSQGEESVSHGCTGMSDEDAKWLYERSRIGDVVVYTGSSRKMETWNGIGVWNYSYDEWSTGSAL